MNLTELVVPLVLDKSKFDKGADDAVSKSEKLKDGLSKVASISLAAVTASIVAIGSAIAGAAKLTFNWANDIDSLGDVMGGTNSEMASFAFVARKAGVDVSSFAQANVIMEKALVKSDGTLDLIGKSLHDYGIEVKDVNGNLKTQTQITNDVAKKYSKLATQQEKVNFLTEIYGKSGAQLIDFFDVLASEGGIDAVTKKVEAFGLAIDPSRYENFNRNLAELKLIGTGLAVTFTEDLMPAFETFMEWTTRFASAPIEEKVKMLADPFKALFNLTDSFNKGVDEIDWAGISTRLATKIQNVDWGTVGLYVRQGVSNVLQGIGTIIDEINWEALGDALGLATADLIAGLYGYPDWEALKIDFNNGFVFIFDYTKNHAFEDFKGWTHDSMMSIGEVMFNGIVNASAPVEKAWDDLIERMKRKWMSLIDLIMSFAGIDIQLPSLGGTAGGGGGSGSGGKVGRRANGGNVTAGESYIVGEYRPEVFVPNQSGRIEKQVPQPKFEIDYDKLGISFRDALLSSGAIG